MPAFAFVGSPSSLNFARSTKSEYSLSVQRNSLRTILSFNEPPTIAPFSIRKICRLPFQPLKLLPSNRRAGFAAAITATTKSAKTMKRRSFIRASIFKSRSITKPQKLSHELTPIAVKLIRGLKICAAAKSAIQRKNVSRAASNSRPNR